MINAGRSSSPKYKIIIHVGQYQEKAPREGQCLIKGAIHDRDRDYWVSYQRDRDTVFYDPATPLSIQKGGIL
jgi:hypothetical protein